MEERAHEHAHPPHRTGHSWLDLSLALSALFVSLCSLWLTLHNARTMERLVAANSYPNIDIDVGNGFDFLDGRGVRPAVYVSLQNTGIGPARLRSVELSFGARAVPNLRALLAICCTEEPAGALPQTSYWHSGDQRGAMIQAGKFLNLFAWAEAPADPRWPRLNAARLKIGLRVCYCSVFDECYLRDNEQREPRRVAACPVAAVPYAGD
jgi:hypothetical protein